MRAVTFLVLLGVALAAKKKSLCNGVDDSALDMIKSRARLGATLILGASCPSFNVDAVAFGGACKKIVKQASCYAIKAADYYNVDVVDYGLLAGDMKNIEHLGNLACSEAPACYNQVAAAIQKCEASNPNFVAETIAAAELAYKTNVEDMVAQFASDNQNSLLGELINMAMDRFSSVEDIRATIDSMLTDQVMKDAAVAATEAQKLAEAWCASGCTSQTASFLKSIFTYMHADRDASGAATCTQASVFCGGCKGAADDWFDMAGNSLPCCLETVIRKGIEAYEYVVANYQSQIDEYSARIESGLTPEAIQEARQIGEQVEAEFNCVKEVYTGNRPTCA